ncbi:MAG TPA: prolyl oligopeptidase family serine peptidase, partial [Candidatus Eremiobacteraceae bacterium]|nr:prolyl oligopeptidase family serine peptidase [Candidatus Eremiobacteraceae bacterium]
RMPNPYKTDGVNTQIELLDLRTHTMHALTTHAGEEAGGEYSPDGSRIMYWYPKAGNPIAINDLFVTAANAGTGNDVTAALDRNAIGATWMQDSRSLLVLAHEGTWAKFWRVYEDGRADAIDTGSINPGAVPSSDPAMSVSADGAIAFAGSEPQRPTELYYMASPTSQPRRLTDFNRFFQSFALGHVSHVEWTGPDGYPEDGVLTYPPDFVAGRRYPLVLQIHGGPNWASVEAFDTDYEGLSQLFAAHGYIVFEPNYRGSDNYGNGYQLAIFNDAGDGPSRDVMAGIEAVEKLGIVDPARIAVSGWSYGGYMTTWLIGHYHLWRCAVAGAAPTDEYVDYAISDYNVIGKYYFKGSPWDSPSIRADYVAQSPITYADQVTTPTLILHDTGDVRVPIVEDYEFFHALRDRGTPVEFVAYPVEGHYPSDPLRGEDIYRRWLGWFDKYLK